MSAPTHQDVVRWCDGAPHNGLNPYAYETHIANAAYAAGYAAAEAQRHAAPDAQAAADAELEACCEWLRAHWRLSDNVAADIVGALRAARRPPALSARDAALDILRRSIRSAENGQLTYVFTAEDHAQLRRALEGGDG